MNKFVHLHLRSEYSIEDSIISLENLGKHLKKGAINTIALTDKNNMFGSVKFYKLCVANHIKPILGCEITYRKRDMNNDFNLILLCQNDIGYRNLSYLISKTYIERENDLFAKFAWFNQKNCAGLIALCGINSNIGYQILHKNLTEAKESIKEFEALFPNRFYMEIVRSERDSEEEYIQTLLLLAEELKLALVASADVRFLKEADFLAHEVKVCINEGTLLRSKRKKRYSALQYLKTPTEMVKLFKDIPQALINSVEIAKRCNFIFDFNTLHQPSFPSSDSLSPQELLIKLAKKGLHERISDVEDSKLRSKYHERLNSELKIINDTEFANYFLIVGDFVAWALQQKIGVGPGRGSGAGSLVAYALKITEIDPLKYNLLFERFLNPQRLTLPDFDIDFCIAGRDRVIEYVTAKYGVENVAQIITYGRLQARAVIRDVGRVLGYSYGFVDSLAKLIPPELGITLKRALQIESYLKDRYQKEEEVRHIFDMADKLEGLVRNVSTHAGGVVIAPRNLTYFLPLYREKGEGWQITQFDKTDIAAIGLHKFDFLGLKTLTIISTTIANINQQNPATKFNINQIALDDPQTFALLKECKTIAIFQLESRGMRDLISRLLPDSFEDIIALLALFRPGPLRSGMVEDFINRKHGFTPAEYFHEKIEAVLKPTYGVILYQEQVMQIAQILGGYSMGDADILRESMSKKRVEDMVKQREIFVTRATAQNIDFQLATRMFDLMEKFAGYGFNRSHSTAYAKIVYQTAWLKANYPLEFMAASLSCEMDNNDKIAILIEECRNLGIKIIAVDINISDFNFKVKDKKIFYGLGAIRGVSRYALKDMILEREQNGDYQDLTDFCRRINISRFKKSNLEKLIKVGAFDKISPNRKETVLNLDNIVKTTNQIKRDHQLKQTDIFGDENFKLAQINWQQSDDWVKIEKLKAEAEILGFYFSLHPIDYYREEIEEFIDLWLKDLQYFCNKEVTTCGVIREINRMRTKTDENLIHLTINDRSGNVNVVMPSHIYHQKRDILVKDNLVIVLGRVFRDDYRRDFRIALKEVDDLNSYRSHNLKKIVISIKSAEVEVKSVYKLKEVLSISKRGRCEIFIDYHNDSGRIKLNLGSSEWGVVVQDSLLESLKNIFRSGNIKLFYR